MPPKGMPGEGTGDDQLDLLCEGRESELVVPDTIEHLLHLMHVELQMKQIRQAAVSHTVAGLMDDMSVILAWHFNDCDPGEQSISSSLTWASDAEPSPAEIDSWSRGAVPARRKPTTPSPLAGGGLSVMTGHADARALTGAPRSPPRQPRPLTGGSNAEEGGQAGQSSSLFIAKSLGPPVKKKREPPLVTETERRAARLNAEKKMERERMERIKTELKGRDYTYDNKGDVIPLESLVPDKLPPVQQALRISLSDAPKQAAPGRTLATSTKSARKSGAKMKLDFSNPPTFKELDSMQPSLMDTMVVGDGVKLTEGDAVKGGDPRSSIPDRMSRKEFEQKVRGGGELGASCIARTITTPLMQHFPPLGAGEGSVVYKPLSDAASAAVDVSLMPASAASGDAPLASLAKSLHEPVGQQPARLPLYKPPSQKSLGQGSEPRNNITRERGGTAVKEKLPPPMLPATIGFGLDPPYTGSQTDNSTANSSTKRANFSPSRAIPPATMKTANPTLLKQVTNGAV